MTTLQLDSKNKPVSSGFRSNEWPFAWTPTPGTLERWHRAQPLRAKFEHLVQTWSEQTRHHSKPQRRLEHPAFEQIVALGEAAIPLILLASYQQSHLLSVAIERMTGQAVEIPEGQRGNVDAIQEAWRQWGKSRGYI